MRAANQWRQHLPPSGAKTRWEPEGVRLCTQVAVGLNQSAPVGQRALDSGGTDDESTEGWDGADNKDASGEACVGRVPERTATLRYRPIPSR